MTDNKLTDEQIIKAVDILEKMDFFGGQRAGRELWFDKPADVQNEDIKNFSNDVAFLKEFINRQKAEIERLQKERQLINLDLTNAFAKMRALRKDIKIAKSEARKELAERLKEKAKYFYCKKDNGFYEECSLIETDIVDNLLKEMENK